MVFERAQWIWAKEKFLRHEYADFKADFSIEQINNSKLRICAKTDYAVWINGLLAGFNQYPDFPDLKIYDEYDLSAYIRTGVNTLSILSVAYNSETFSRITDGKGIIFEIENNGKVELYSDEHVLSRIDKNYKSGDVKEISMQLGYSFEYDFGGGDFMQGDGFVPSFICGAKTKFAIRPVKKLKATSISGRHISNGLYDFGRVMAGYLSFEIYAECECELTVSYGEHILDGGIRQKIGSRDFSAVFHLKKGINVFDEYFLRFGLRYLQFSLNKSDNDNDIKILRAQIRESTYPLTVNTMNLSKVRQQIYSVSAATLVNCMHEHYEDCPWREQAQYTMDSRSQMLCGYYAFSELEFPRACLMQMIHYLNDDGYIPMTTPTHMQKTISSFNLVFFLALKEYVSHSGDESIIKQTKSNCEKVLQKFISRLKDSLVPDDSNVWNFFEWSDGLEDNGFFAGEMRDRFSLPLNCWLIIALNSYAELLCRIGDDGEKYRKISEQIKAKLVDFFDECDGLYYTYRSGDGKFYHKAEYTQFLALYAGVPVDRKSLIERVLKSKSIVPMSLASYIYRYEVLLGEGGYKNFVLSEVDSVWGKMISEGATTFWETTAGAADFCGAGSLCHGWSSIPIFVYKKCSE